VQLLLPGDDLPWVRPELDDESSTATCISLSQMRAVFKKFVD